MSFERFDFADKVAVVTGAGGSIGGAICGAFSRAGASVIAADLESALAEVATSHETNGHGFAIACDVTNRTSVQSLVQSTIRQFGRLDILVNNAGVNSVYRFADLPESEWDRIMDVNAKGTFLCSQAVVSHMRERQGGVIVNISSQAARRGEPLIAHYCAAKAAVIGLTRALALEAAPEVRVNCVCPGTIKTAMVESAWKRQAALLGVETSALAQMAVDRTPLHRLQEPIDVAEAVMFLASDAARQMTGQVLHVSGGLIMD